MSPQPTRLSRLALASRFRGVKWHREGRVAQVTGGLVVASLPHTPLGCLAEIATGSGDSRVLAEVVGFRDDRTLLLAFGSLAGVSPGARVRAREIEDTIPVGPELLGCVVDAFMRPLDDQGGGRTRALKERVPLERAAPNPIARQRITQPMSLGIRAIDALLTFCEGQRIGIMAGSGVGKSVLLGMIARYSAADVNVIGLVGERGREVREFIEKDLGEAGLRRSVVVVATSDQSPLTRLRAAKAATAVAESFSRQGKRVLLMVDSLTRVAQSQREIGLAVGELPTTRGYPPSVFSLMPRLLERCGPQENGWGSISGIYTVLVDGDDFNDPMPDAARAILDGHIVLSRTLASRGHFPAIDVSQSVSRVMADNVSAEHQNLASYTKSLLGIYQENLDLINIGAYQRGANPTLDLALELQPRLEGFLRQEVADSSTMDEALAQLMTVYRDYNRQTEEASA